MIERDFCVRKVSGGDSLWGFVRGLYGVLGFSRVICWMFGWGFTPILGGIYVLQHVKGVVKMTISYVNDGIFLPALDTFGKKHRPHRRWLRRQPFGLAPGLSHSVPLAARSDQSLSPSANCSRSRFVVAYLKFWMKLLVI